MKDSELVDLLRKAAISASTKPGLEGGASEVLNDYTRFLQAIYYISVGVKSISTRNLLDI